MSDVKEIIEIIAKSQLCNIYSIRIHRTNSLDQGDHTLRDKMPEKYYRNA